jgi:hypothetical protein
LKKSHKLSVPSRFKATLYIVETGITAVDARCLVALHFQVHSLDLTVNFKRDQVVSAWNRSQISGIDFKAAVWPRDEYLTPVISARTTIMNLQAVFINAR